ncbi:disease resistance protein Pik-1-like isoform X1 [Nicotiana tabacum]|uniref:Disease resistance protein Pik-1-like isoform X1 n=3 Tax=Nicotiana tabacum TaxID=4097 RepID=A0A1S4BZU0_TOBAC
MKKKVVIKVSINGNSHSILKKFLMDFLKLKYLAKCWGNNYQDSRSKNQSKVLLIAAKIPGVEKVAIEGEEKNELMVIGEEIDAAELVTTLRKKVGFANIVSSWRKDAEGLFGNSLSTPRGRESSYRR